MNSLINNKIIRLLIGLCLITLSGCFHNNDGTTDAASISESLNQTGGEVSHESGFTATFPDGALPESVNVNVSEVARPRNLPSKILAGNHAFKIDGLGNV